MKMKKNGDNILIWEALSFLGGGQRVALDVLDALQEDFCCIAAAPGRGRFAEEVRSRGLRFEVLPIGEYSLGQKTTFDICRLAVRYPSILKQALQLVREAEVGLIYANAARILPWSVLLGALCRIPVIWHAHNFFDDRRTKGLLEFLASRHTVVRVVFPSHALMETFPTLSGKAEILPNGVDLVTWRRMACEVAGPEPQMGHPTLVNVSRISETKRQDVLIRAVPFVLRERSDARFVIVGGVRSEEAAFGRRLIELARDLGVDDRVEFAGERNDVWRVLRGARLNIVTSQECFPLSILEAAALGIPTIGPDVAGAKEIIESWHLGSTYRYLDPENLAEVTLELLHDDHRLRDLSASVQEAVEELDKGHFYRRVKTIVEDVLQHQAAS